MINQRQRILNNVVKLSFLFLFFIRPGSSEAQNHRFTHYSIQNGLVQSQVLKIFQDSKHYLWVTTYGGISKFNGKEFASYTKSDGLENNMVTAINQDKKGRIWLGAETGLYYINGKAKHHYSEPANTKGAWIKDIVEDNTGTIWCIRKSKLFIVKEQKITAVNVTANNEYITCLTVSNTGKLCVAVLGKGIFCLKQKNWVRLFRFESSLRDISIIKMVFDKNNENKVFLLTPRSLFIAEKNTIKPISNHLLNKQSSPLFSLAQDETGGLWIGTNTGAYYLKDETLIHFTALNGFTNFSVTDIYLDKEDNIWLATDGAGIYKYEGNSFVSFEKFNGTEQVIMGIAHDKSDNMLMGTFNNGILKLSGDSVSNLYLPSKNPYSKHINTLYNKPDGNILIGSLDGLWQYDHRSFTRIGDNDSMPKFIRSIAMDEAGTIWMAAPKGCFFHEHGKAHRISHLDYSANVVLCYGKDSILAGTDHGLVLIRKKTLDKTFRIIPLEKAAILCLVKYKNLVLAGTFGDGLFVCDLRNKTVKQYSTKTGLLSNDIYSLTIDNQGLIWTGTGRGVNKFTVDHKSGKLTLFPDASSKALIECNQNSILYFKNKVWVGTTNGLYVYKTNNRISSNKKPFINIQLVKVPSANPGRGKAEFQLYSQLIPGTLRLKYTQNRIAISFRGIYLSNPDDVSYLYRLNGLDEHFNGPISSNFIEYPSLQPGKYTFEVQALTSGGAKSNIDTISFEITPPFYQTWIFKLVAFFLIVLGILSVQYFMNKREAHRLLMIEKIKNEEQLKIRSQTAEDFHDDIGNKLTRIAILSDILDKKLAAENTEQKELVRQIIENAATVYSGTKDILWALDPQSDNLYEILTFIQDFGIDLFNGTSTIFIPESINPDYKSIALPMEYSRNLSLIFKELLSNVLKHSKAGTVTLNVTNTDEICQISLRDDGVGFNTDNQRKGRGLKNIQVRAQRINAKIKFISEPGKGSLTVLTFKPNI